MPKIVNPRYKKHPGARRLFKPMEPKEFYDRLKTIDSSAVPARFSTKAMRYYFLLLYWTGRRPSEILELRREDLAQHNPKEGAPMLTIFSKTKKGGNDVVIYLTFENIPLLPEFWEWVKDFPMEMRPFWELWSLGKKTVKYPFFESFYEKTSESLYIKRKIPTQKQKVYPFPVGRLQYWSNKLFSIPLYFFRHNRFTIMVAFENASFSEIKIFKGAKSMKSVEPYIRDTEEQMKALAAKVRVSPASE